MHSLNTRGNRSLQQITLPPPTPIHLYAGVLYSTLTCGRVDTLTCCRADMVALPHGLRPTLCQAVVRTVVMLARWHGLRIGRMCYAAMLCWHIAYWGARMVH